MIEITLTGMDAEDYIYYRRSRAVPPKPAPIEPTPEPPVTTRVEAEAKKFKDIVSSPKPETHTNDLASDWRALVDAGVPADLVRDMWSKQDLEIIRISVGKTSPHYYSVETLSTYLGRTPSAIRSTVNRLGFRVVDGMVRYGK